MEPRLELAIRRKIKQAQDSGDSRAELEARRLLRDVEQGYVSPEMGAVEGFMVDMGRGFMDIGQGAKSLAYDVGSRFGMVEPETADQYRADVADEVSMYERDRGAFNAGRLTGNVLATAPIPGGIAGNAFTRMGTAAMAGAGIGAMYPTQTDDPWQERGQNAFFGGVGGGVGSAIMSGAGKVYNAFTGRLGSDAAQEVVDTSNTVRNALSTPGSRAADMPLSVGDIRGGAIVPKTETHLENIPLVGFGGIRERQNRAAKDWASRLIERIDDGSVDVGDEIAKGASTKFEYLRDVANKAFSEIGQEVDQYGSIPLTRLQQAAIKHRDILDGIVQRNPQFEALFGPNLSKLQTLAEQTDLTYSEVRVLRDYLSDMVDNVMPGNSPIGKRGAAPIVEMRQAMEKDITDFMKQIGGDMERKYLKAKRFYEKRVVPYKAESKTGLSQLLKDTEPDRLLRKWVYGDKTDKAKRLWMSLNQDGREAVKIGILRDAYENATNRASSEYGVFSHAGFASTLDKYRKAIPQFFSKDDEKIISGFQKVLRHTQRAGQYMENPSTGARNALPMMIGGGAVAGATLNPTAAAQVVGGVLGLRWLFGSKSGRNLLLSASDIDVDSKAMKSLVKQITRATARTSASANAFRSDDSRTDDQPYGQR